MLSGAPLLVPPAGTKSCPAQPWSPATGLSLGHATWHPIGRKDTNRGPAPHPDPSHPSLLVGQPGPGSVQRAREHEKYPVLPGTGHLGPEIWHYVTPSSESSCTLRLRKEPRSKVFFCHLQQQSFFKKAPKKVLVRVWSRQKTRDGDTSTWGPQQGTQQSPSPAPISPLLSALIVTAHSPAQG